MLPFGEISKGILQTPVSRLISLSLSLSHSVAGDQLVSPRIQRVVTAAGRPVLGLQLFHCVQKAT